MRVAQRFDPMSHPRILEVVESVERRFNGRGRTVLRPSGTEPVIRVMVEGHDAKLVKAAARDIAAAVEAAAVASARGLCTQCGTGTCSWRPTRLIFAAFREGPYGPRVWACVVPWSPVTGKCMDRARPTRLCSASSASA